MLELSSYSFSTCEYSSSTGVTRPKIHTATSNRAFSSSTSSTKPLNVLKGPSLTRTCSPTSTMALAMALQLLDLRVFQLDRRGAAEDRHRHFQSRLLLVDL